MGARQDAGVDETFELFLRDVALGYPGAVEEFPWGERAIKAGKKTFLFMGTTEKGLGLSLKLPASNHEALLLPFAERTGYGLGKHGWVSARFGPGEKPPLALIAAWIEESYRAVAAKKLIAELDALGDEPRTLRAPRARARRKKA